MGKTRQGEKKNKGSLKGWLIKIPVVLAAVYLLGLFVSGQIQVNAKQRELAALETALEQQTQTNAELERMMESGDQDAYIERIAREKLGYARPDERIFVDITGE